MLFKKNTFHFSQYTFIEVLGNMIESQLKVDIFWRPDLRILRPRCRRVFIGAVSIFLPLGGSRNKLKGAIYKI